MKDHAERILINADFGLERDVVHVRTRLKVTSRVRVWLERSVRIVVLENNHTSRNRRVQVGFGKKMRGDLAKLLQTLCHLANFFFAGITDEEKVPGANAHPRVLRNH